MDFFKNMRDVIHGFSHETRMVIAMAIMGIAVLSFFAIWNTVVPLRLIALSPIPPAAEETENTGPAQLTMAGPFEPVPVGGVEPRTEDSQDVLTPAEGIVGTLAGLGGLFAPASGDQSFTSMARSLGDFGWSVIRGAVRFWDMTVDFVAKTADALRRMSFPLVAPTY